MKTIQFPIITALLGFIIFFQGCDRPDNAQDNQTTKAAQFIQDIQSVLGPQDDQDNKETTFTTTTDSESSRFTSNGFDQHAYATDNESTDENGKQTASLNMQLKDWDSQVVANIDGKSKEIDIGTPFHDVSEDAVAGNPPDNIKDSCAFGEQSFKDQRYPMAVKELKRCLYINAANPLFTDDMKKETVTFLFVSEFALATLTIGNDDFDAALGYYEEAVTFYESHKGDISDDAASEFVPSMYVFTSSLYYMKTSYDNAIMCAKKALDFDLDLDYQKMVYAILAKSYSIQGDPGQSKDYTNLLETLGVNDPSQILD